MAPDISIDREAVAKHMPADHKVNSKKQIEWYNYIFSQIEESFRNLKPDADYMHFDDVQVNMTQGANANRSLDVRAVTETVDVQMLNALKQLGTLVNRHTGKTETYSTVEFSITIRGIKSIQQGSKRLIEEVARLWLRVKESRLYLYLRITILTMQASFKGWTLNSNSKNSGLLTCFSNFVAKIKLSK